METVFFFFGANHKVGRNSPYGLFFRNSVEIHSVAMGEFPKLADVATFAKL